MKDLRQNLNSLVNEALEELLDNDNYNEDFFAEVAEFLRATKEHNFPVQQQMLLRYVLDLFVLGFIKPTNNAALAFLVYLKYIDSYFLAEKLVAVAQVIRSCAKTDDIRLEIYKKFFELIKKAPYYIYDHAVWQIKALKYDERRYLGALLLVYGADPELVKRAFLTVLPDKQHLITFIEQS